MKKKLTLKFIKECIAKNPQLLLGEDLFYSLGYWKDGGVKLQGDFNVIAPQLETKLLNKAVKRDGHSFFIYFDIKVDNISFCLT